MSIFPPKLISHHTNAYLGLLQKKNECQINHLNLCIYQIKCRSVAGKLSLSCA